MAETLRIRKNDIVKVTAGREKGKVGRILKVNAEDGRVVIEKINLVKRHASNVMIMCEKCNRPTRVKAVVDGAGGKQRACKRCGDVIEAKKK
jgi:large subunit ribosomal protein L24